MDEDVLKQELGLKNLTAFGNTEGGEICSSQAYQTDHGTIFVKRYPGPGARTMFEGEFDSLERIRKTHSVQVPSPMRVIDVPQGAVLVMEYLDIKERAGAHSRKLGENLAEMHLFNQRLLKRGEINDSYVGQGAPRVRKFGLDMDNYYGRFQMVNEWNEDWVRFFARNRLKLHMDILERNYGDREVLRLWPHVERNLAKIFPSSLTILPSLLHGDFWHGNTGDLSDGPCVFDPCVFYGHSEYDITIVGIFPGMPQDFFDEYHKLIPKTEGYEARAQIYKLFNFLNHWNHFGPVQGFREETLRLMKGVAELC